LRAIADPELICYYSDLHDPAREYGRKVRTVVRGMTAVANMRALLNPWRHGWYAFQLWGHKVMRWLTPVFLVLLWLASAALALHGLFYAIAFLVQTAAYAIAGIAALVPGLQKLRPLRLAFYFVQVHMALLDALIRYLRNERIVAWDPSVR
jgi:hypothetical protein